MTFQQLPLFNTHATGGNTAPEIAPTRRTAPQTSHDAGKKVGPHLSRLREQALAKEWREVIDGLSEHAGDVMAIEACADELEELAGKGGSKR
jgi:hypothetical protein